MTTLRADAVADQAINLLANPDHRRHIEGLLHLAGETTAEALTLVGTRNRWSHSLEFRCEPIGRHIDGMETVAAMDSHDAMEGTILVGCAETDVDRLSSMLTTLTSGDQLTTSARAQEATNIIGSAYLNGLRTALNDNDRAGSANLEFSDKAFLPSPPRFVQVPVHTMLELAVGGQAMGDRGWIADHRLRCGTEEIVTVWIPTSQALVRLGQLPAQGAAA